MDRYDFEPCDGYGESCNGRMVKFMLGDYVRYDEAQSQLRLLELQNQKLVEALEFYAEKENYMLWLNGGSSLSVIDEDEGTRAAAALKEMGVSEYKDLKYPTRQDMRKEINRLNNVSKLLAEAVIEAHSYSCFKCKSSGATCDKDAINGISCCQCSACKLAREIVDGN